MSPNDKKVCPPNCEKPMSTNGERNVLPNNGKGMSVNGEQGVSANGKKGVPSNGEQRVSASGERISFAAQGCDAFLRKYPQLKEYAERTIATQMDNGLFKSKFATARRWDGSPIMECRVNAGKVGAFRVAFITKGDTALVIYISRTLQKRDFTAEIERFLERTQR